MFLRRIVLLVFLVAGSMCLFSQPQVDLDHCSILENEADVAYCRRNLGDLQDFHQISDCDQILNESLREVCYWEKSVVETDVDYCENVNQPYRDICYWDVSVTTFARNGRQYPNFSICERIINPEVREGCLNKSYAMEQVLEGKPFFENRVRDEDYEECDVKDEFAVDWMETTVMMVMQGESEEKLGFFAYGNDSVCVGGRCGVPGWEFKSNAQDVRHKRNPFYELVDVTVIWPDGRKSVLEKDLNLATVAPDPIGGLTYRFVKYGTYQGFLPVGDYGFLFRKVDGRSCVVSERYDGEVVNIPEHVIIEKKGDDLKIRWNQGILKDAGFEVYQIVVYTQDRGATLWSNDYKNKVTEENELVIEQPPLTLGQNYTLHFYAQALHGHAAEFIDFTWE